MTASRQRIKQGQKTWKYIHDANSQSVADLSKIAIEDGKTTYTYGLMFRTWEQYASVFSALKMTGENKARVGVLGSTSAEVIFAYYGLNMVGAEVSLVPAYSALTPSKVIETIKNEHFTDFIVTSTSSTTCSRRRPRSACATSSSCTSPSPVSRQIPPSAPCRRPSTAS